jgi:molybdopterin-guanine dinucleotide biosynthesis protein A
MTTPNDLPRLDKEIIEYLREVFKVKVHEDYVLTHYFRQIGHKDVIDHLQHIWNEQNKREE